MDDADRETKRAIDLRERVLKAVKFHREIASRGKNPAIPAKMGDLLSWLEGQTDLAWWLKKEKSCDATVAGINALWREYQLDTFGEWTEKEIVLRM